MFTILYESLHRMAFPLSDFSTTARPLSLKAPTTKSCVMTWMATKLNNKSFLNRVSEGRSFYAVEAFGNGLQIPESSRVIVGCGRCGHLERHYRIIVSSSTALENSISSFRNLIGPIQPSLFPVNNCGGLRH